MTNLKITRNHCESGSIIGTLDDQPIDYSWNSHELWINGECNPEDHPFENTANEIFRQCDELLQSRHNFPPNVDLADVPFTAEYTDVSIENLVLGEMES